MATCTIFALVSFIVIVLGVVVGTLVKLCLYPVRLGEKLLPAANVGQPGEAVNRDGQDRSTFWKLTSGPIPVIFPLMPIMMWERSWSGTSFFGGVSFSFFSYNNDGWGRDTVSYRSLCSGYQYLSELDCIILQASASCTFIFVVIGLFSCCAVTYASRKDTTKWLEAQAAIAQVQASAYFGATVLWPLSAQIIIHYQLESEAQPAMSWFMSLLSFLVSFNTARNIRRMVQHQAPDDGVAAVAPAENAPRSEAVGPAVDETQMVRPRYVTTQQPSQPQQQQPAPSFQPEHDPHPFASVPQLYERVNFSPPPSVNPYSYAQQQQLHLQQQQQQPQRYYDQPEGIRYDHVAEGQVYGASPYDEVRIAQAIPVGKAWGGHGFALPVQANASSASLPHQTQPADPGEEL